MNLPMYPELTSAVARRLLELKGRRQPVPVMPALGEGLADVMLRSAHLNGLQNLGRTWGDRIMLDYSHLGVALSHINLAKLGDLIGTPNGAADLEPIRFSRYKTPEQGTLRARALSRFNFFGNLMLSHQLTRSRRVSPQSLEKKLISKAIWHVSSLNFAPDTHEQLIEACPDCGESLSFQNAAGFHQCTGCGVDFRSRPQPIAEVEDREALRFVTGLIDPESAVAT